ncbi:Protein CBG03077 [Caenorhabditis briggsae]|uniref:Protein CBG03077 n=1 Tax=Caenorhabditis briggsae TaxID=6238 RepID=A8WSU7_CAEBR|nr:Protein CBG03077 [Caenorhabditis briggsae]CAP23556.2 Protein CBG03077 [Caenorhabditis briggsae]
MADAVEPAAAPEAVPEAQAGGFWQLMKQAVTIYFMVSMVSNFLRPSTPGTSTNGTSTTAAGNKATNLFPNHQLFDLYVYMDENEFPFKQFDSAPEKLVWMRSAMRYDDWTSGENNDGSFTSTELLLRNESLYLHTFIVKTGQSPNPKDRNYFKNQVVYKMHQLNKFKKKYYKKTANLLTGESEQSEEDLAKAQVMKFEVLNHWHPNISISLVVDQSPWARGSIPSPLSEDIEFNEDGDVYKPIIFYNNWWNLGADYQPINETVKELNLTITYYPMSIFKYQMYASQKMQSQWQTMLSMDMGDTDGDEHDSMKQALLETNPILLAVTMVVSLLHTVFEFLAFKNDIQFWNNRKDLVGLSVRSVLFNIFQSLIVFLYICDNETNTMVKFTVGIGLLIECWKIPKVMNVSVDWQNKWFGLIPRVVIADKGSYVESETKVYDQMAFKYLGWALFPLLVGYAIYSVIYVEQKGWYSWVLNMLYGFLLTFGFITMTPQLFINYKLKSVAHLPWRMLTYKFINTFIDDLFAFVIRMPLLYRIGCFRDDIIFLIYLYQRWAYRVDPTRLNEFGTSLEKEAGAEPAAVEGSQNVQETAPEEEDKKTK